MYKRQAYAEGRKLSDLTLENIPALLQDPADAFVWLDLREPDEALMGRIQALFGLHELAAEDAHRAHQRPKAERYGYGLFVAVRPAQRGGGQVDFGETHLFVGPRYLVSVRHGASLPYAPVRTRCENNPKLLATGPGFVLYAILDFVVDQYFPILDGVEDTVEQLEERFFKGDFSPEDTSLLYERKRDLVSLRRAVAPLVEVANYLLTDAFASHISSEIRIYLRDVCDHALRINETVDTLRETLMMTLQISLSLSATRQNEATKKLAGWGAVSYTHLDVYKRQAQGRALSPASATTG